MEIKNNMDLTTYVRRPFEVKAIEITVDNISDLAPGIGKLKYEGGDPNKPFIEVDRRKVPSVYKVFPGYFMTVMGDNIRCYSPKVFAEQFVRATPDIASLMDHIRNATPDAIAEVPQPESEVAVSPTQPVEVAPGVTVQQGEIEINVFDDARAHSAEGAGQIPPYVDPAERHRVG